MSSFLQIQAKLLFILFIVLNIIPYVIAQTYETGAVKNFTKGSVQFDQLEKPRDIEGLYIWAIPSNGSTSSFSRAPSNGWKFQRTEYLITPSEMVLSGFPSGAIINSIGFAISSAGTGTLTGALNIYLKNTSDTEYMLGSGWTTSGFTQVNYNTGFTVPVTPAGGSYNIAFAGASPFTYTGGGLYVAWEFSSPDGNPGTLNVTHYCNTDLPDGLYGQRSALALPTTLAASNWRPATRLGTTTYNDIIDITNIYTLGKVPVPFGVPPSLGVRVANVSPFSATFDLTITVRDAVDSIVRYTDTQTLTNFAGNSATTVNFPGWTPADFENVIITAATSEIPEDTWIYNNTRSTTANVNNFLFSYNYNTVDPNGYGFNYPGTGIFAAKYTMNGSGRVIGANLVIADNSTNIGNTIYAVAINSSGTIVGQSENYIIQPGDLGTTKNFAFISPPVFNNQLFYVGLAQTTGSAQWYPLGIFAEVPQRGNTFYVFPITGGAPSVDNVTAKYGIEALVTDVSAEIIDAGTVSVDIASSQNPGIVTPYATVKNFGSTSKTFNVMMTITGGYSSTKTVTNLASGASHQVTFDLWNAEIGDYSVNVCTQLEDDQNPLNDCLSKSVGVYLGNWSTGTPFPVTTYLGTGVGYKSSVTGSSVGYLFSIGGNTTSALATEVFKYNVTTGAWSAAASLPSPRKVLASALLGDQIYAIGGTDQSSVYQSSVFKYNINANSWTNAAPLPAAIAWGKAVAYKDKIYLAGGINASGTTLSSVYVYNSVTNTWSAGTSMPQARFGGAFSIAGNKLVYIGGANNSVINGDVFVGTISETNPLNITWVNAGMYPGLQAESLSDPSVKLSEAMKINGNIPVNTEDLDIYPPGSMYRFDAAPWGTNAVIVAGGSPASSWIPANPSPCYKYNPYTNTWTKQADVPVPVLGASIGTVNNGNTWKLIIVSGLGLSQTENNTQIWTDTAVTETFQLTVSLSGSQWHIVSIPGLHPDNQHIDTWFPYRDPSASVFRFTTTYQSVMFLEPGIGYWLKHQPRVYNTGDEWPASGILAVPHNPIPALAGFNLFGPYEETVSTSGLTTSPSGLIIGSVFRYQGGYQVATTLTPGYGYWVKLSGQGFINIPSASSGMSKDVPDGTENFGRIIITDNASRSYTLYTAQEGTDLNWFELPPLPPQGMFDIRYSSQRCVEVINGNQRQIDMTGVMHPVKIKAEDIGIILSDETGREIIRLKAGEESVLNSSSNKLFVTENIIPSVYSLEQNYPNPFNPATTIQFSIPEDVKNVKLIIYSSIGEKVAELVNTSLEAGYYRYIWNAGNAASGMYICQMVTEKFISVKKMLLLK